MKPTVVSNEYVALQTEISNKQSEWAKKLEQSKVIEKKPLQHKQIPVIAQVDVTINQELYKEWIFDLAALLEANSSDLKEDIAVIKETLTEETVIRWANEVLTFNQYYFQSFAEENKVAEWLPYFLAEHAIRPFLRVVAEVYTEEIPNLKTKGSCSCCGEPIRLAVLEGKGKKMIVCPRCEAKWQQKRLHCSFCGNEDHDKISYYNVENDSSSKLEVCDTCNGYIKIIDTRKLFKKQSAFLLDVNSIHLDFVAQENGFGARENEEEVKS